MNPLTTTVTLVVLAPGAQLYNVDGAEVGTVGDAPLTVEIRSEAPDHLIVGPTSSKACTEKLRSDGLDVSLRVDRKALLPVLDGPLELDGGEGFTLRAAAGLPVEGKRLLYHVGVELEVAPPTTTVFSPPVQYEHATGPSRTHQMVLEAPNGAWTATLPRDDLGWHVEALGEGWRYRATCVDVSGRGDPGEQPELVGVLGGLGLRGSGVEVPAGTALEFEDGSPAGQTVDSWYPGRPATDDGRTCGSPAALFGPEPLSLRLCWRGPPTVKPVKPAGPTPPLQPAPPRNPARDARHGLKLPKPVRKHLKLRIDGSEPEQITASLQRKADSMGALKESLSMDEPAWAVVFEDMAASLLDASTPELPEQAVQVYADTIFDKALQFCTKAAEHYGRHGDTAAQERLGSREGCATAVDW